LRSREEGSVVYYNFYRAGYLRVISYHGKSTAYFKQGFFVVYLSASRKMSRKNIDIQGLKMKQSGWFCKIKI
jgi:hypothetical protein